MLPALVVLAIAVAVPRLLTARPKLRYYAHASAAVSILCWSSFFVWYWSNLAEPEVHLLPAGFTGEVLILHDVPDGAEPKREQGRRVYEIPESGILRSQFPPNDGIYRRGAREFFYVGPGGERVPLRDSGAFIASSGSGAAMQEPCDVHYDGYFVAREPLANGATIGSKILEYLSEHPVPCPEPPR